MLEETEKVQSINAVLMHWQGVQAQFWTYTASLATLEIRLFSERRPGHVHLVCSPCLSITGPVYWERCALTVAADHSEDGLLIVQDRAAGVRVLCRGVAVFENVEPALAAPAGKGQQQRSVPSEGQADHALSSLKTATTG